MARYYDFFFSFSSIDWRRGQRDDLRKLFERIQSKLREFSHIDGGFFAPDSIHRGQRWEPTLVEALQASRVLVPVYSPNYFRSIYCAKEWQAFIEREAENRSSLGQTDVTEPEVILPILWTAPVKYPERVTDLQNSHGADPDTYLARGLGYMMQSPTKFEDHISEFIDGFGRELGRLVETQGATKMRAVSDWDALAPPFPLNYRHGLGYVRYVFLAGRRDEMRSVRTTLDAYGHFESRKDWRPCFPVSDRQAGELAHAAALELQKDCEFVEVRSTDQLIKRLAEARALKNIVVLIVDPWSLRLKDLEDVARRFDTESFPTSGVIVTWNEKDGETAASQTALKDKLLTHFIARKGRKEYLHERVTSPIELRNALIEAFNAAQEKLLESGRLQSASGAGPAEPLPSVHT